MVDSPSQEGSEKKYSQVTTSILKEGDVVEMPTYEGKKEELIYYIVQDGIFYAYLKRYP